MKKTGVHILIFAMIVLFSVSQLYAQPQREVAQKPPLTRILFIFDASYSMMGRWQSDLKINIAQRLLIELIDSLENIDNLELALRIYGHQSQIPPQDCSDSRLEIKFSKGNHFQIKQKLRSVVPRGTTPIAYSLEQGASDFPSCENCRNIIILITDGLEECKGDPCAVSIALQKKGIILRPFIIGIGKDFAQAFDCVGTYFDASDEVSFRTALNVAISQAINNTTLQVNLLDQAANPTETNVNMTFYDRFSGKIRYNYIHTMNSKGFPDTLIVDPLSDYRIVTHTLPPVVIDSAVQTPGKHTTVGTDAAQGYLRFKFSSNSLATKTTACIVRTAGDMQTLNVQYPEITEKYLIGNYDLEILTLPRTYIPKVNIRQSYTTDVVIPAPGLVIINKSTNGYGSIYVEEKNLLKWVCNLDGQSFMETLYLQPGSYRVIFRSRSANRALYTIERAFKVESEITNRINIYQ
jgi:Ca-activated chloride channel family protein